MPKLRKAGVVDGYAAIKAAQHAARTRPAVAPSRTEHTSRVEGEPTDLKSLGAAITRTAVPAKHIIECYECGYKFQLHGKAAKTNCSKCRATLDISNHTIDKKWSGTLKTAGDVHVTSDGVVEAGSITCHDFILEGAVQAGIVKAMRRLELRPSARFSEHSLKAPDLLIAPSATIAILEPAEYCEVEIAGALRANLHTTGTTRIRPGGCFEGKLRTNRLVIEEGGGLLGEVSP